MKHQECLLLTKSLKGFFPPVLYSYSLGGKDFLLELIKQRELNSLRVVFMSEKGQGITAISDAREVGINTVDRRNKNRIAAFSNWILWTKYFSFRM